MPTKDLASLLPSPQNSSQLVPMHDLKLAFLPTGPPPSPLMIGGEAPAKDGCARREPFTGYIGKFVDECLTAAGWTGIPAFRTHVARSQPPSDNVDLLFAGKVKDRTVQHVLRDGKWADSSVVAGAQLLRQEVATCRPTVVIALGNVALWALTGKWGVRKWRSSILQAEIDGHKFKVIPTYAPKAVYREWTLRPLVIHDMRRARTELDRGPIVAKPPWRFVVRPTYQQAHAVLAHLLHLLDTAREPLKLSSDIETRAGHTACLGIAWSRTEAICIPFMCVERLTGYWALEEETELVWLIRLILAHPMAKVIWQNGAYDHQYEWRWHFYLPNMGWDTMLAHHAMFSTSPKGLDHLSSLYCDYHVYWKEDGRLWDPSTMPEEQYWTYNCEDCVRTYEIADQEEAAIASLTQGGWTKLPEVVAFQHEVQPVITKMMLRGVRSDDTSRTQMAMTLLSFAEYVNRELEELCGQPLNINSPKQMTEFFYGVLNQSPIYSRNPDGSRGNPTCDDEALLTVAAREPLLRPVVARIQALRSGGKFHSTYVQMARDVDGRLRCAYNVAGTKTYRLASSENAFGSGGNLQNIPTGDESEDAIIPLPNIKELFLFDDGMTGFDLDGDSADLRIVTGESGCRQMQAYFAAKVKPYVEIAKEYFKDPTITKHHPSYKTMKALCHGSNYGGEPAGLAERIGLIRHDVERMQNWYFGMCPEIKAWQEEIRNQILSRGWIENPFGYRLWNWDRPSRKLVNEALAWTPQSTVGLLVNKIAVRIDREIPEVQLLLQVHDSLNGQYPTHLGEPMRDRILRLAESVPVPCKTGTIYIPAGMKTSTKNWGDCK